MHFVKAIGDWLAGHPLWLACLTLVIGGLVSVFSSDIRALVKVPPQKLGRWILEVRLESATEKLATLKELKSSDSKLIIYLIKTIIFMVFGIAAFVVVILDYVIVSDSKDGLHEWGLLVGGASLLTFSFGRLILRQSDLRRFGYVEAELEDTIKMLRKKLGHMKVSSR